MRPNNFDLRRTGAIVLCLAAVTMFCACGGNANKKQAADGATETAQTETKAPKGVKVADIPKDKITVMVGSTDSEKQAAIAEIPAELLKTVGELSNCVITKSTTNDWKYTMVINGKQSEDPHADLATLTDYYKSAGGTVVETAVSNGTKKYRVTFPGAESLDIYPFGGSIQIQWNVVKK